MSDDARYDAGPEELPEPAPDTEPVAVDPDEAGADPETIVDDQDVDPEAVIDETDVDPEVAP